MDTLIRYLSSEAIENCVLCLNYQFDNVVFYAYEAIKDEEESNISSFLIDDCNVKNVTYRVIDDSDIDYLINDVGSLIDNNKYFIDLTGCDGICQVAFNKVALEKNIPMYLYDVRKTKLLSLNNCDYDIDLVYKRKVKLNIEKYIRMVGGVILENMQKDNKAKIDEVTFNKLNTIKTNHEDVWIAFSFCMQQSKSKNINDELEARCYNIESLIDQADYRISIEELLTILSELKENNLIRRYSQFRKEFVFSYCSKQIMNTILESGSILEMQVYEHEKKTATDCAIGIHLDWDGVIERSNDGNVINEVDVLRLDNYELTFISCKNTKKIDKNALYELETVARRFGGKYSNMKLVCNGEVSITDKNRAKLIGIEVLDIEELLKN